MSAFPLWPFVMSALPTLQQLILCRAHLNNCARAHVHLNRTHGYLYLTHLWPGQCSDEYRPALEKMLGKVPVVGGLTT